MTVFPTSRELPALWLAWECGTVTPQQVYDCYSGRSAVRVTYHVLHRLTEKGFLVRHENGYSPTMTRQQAADLLIGGTVCN